MIYEPLHATNRVLAWDCLPKSAAPTVAERAIADTETRDEVAQCFLAYRNLATLADKPLTQEWLHAAISLCLSQPEPEPLSSLLSAFRIGTSEYERLLRHAANQNTVAKFRSMEKLRRRSLIQYEAETGASRRLLEAVCTSEVVRLRARPGTFNWLEALRERKLIAFDGGGLRSNEVKRTLFLMVSLTVIQAVRRHFAETREPLPVVLVLEEAGALGLVTPFMVSALQELRKAGLVIHLITQSTLDFGSRDTFEAILSNTPCQVFYQLLSPADQELAAKVLANPTFDAHAVHFTRTRQLHDGVERVETISRGESTDGKTRRRDWRKTLSLIPRFKEIKEEHYVTPQLHEQEYRTKLATLKVGERFVRDRAGVRFERVTMLPPSRPLGLSEKYAAAAIERIRQQPVYEPVPLATVPASNEHLDAAAALRERMKEECDPQ